MLKKIFGLEKISAGIFCTGVLFIIVGFIILSKVNRMASNWAGFVSPAVLLAGWVLIAVGLWKAEE